MYRISKKIKTSLGKPEMFQYIYLDDGNLFEVPTEDEALDKIKELIKTNIYLDLDIIQIIPYEIDVTSPII